MKNPMKSMIISPEKQALFEKLYEAEGEVVRHGHNFQPPELKLQEDLTEYRIWRHWNKEVPRNNEAIKYCTEKWDEEAGA